jgi:hypothetical protein
MRFMKVAMAALLLAMVTAVAQAAPDTGSDPKERALEIYKAFKSKEWSHIFDLSALPAAAANEKNARQAFVNGIEGGLNKNPESKKQFDDLVNGMSNLKTGKAEVKGSHAVVPTSSVCKMKGVTLNLNGRIVLIKQKGVWKWDLTSNDTGEIEKASSQVFMVRPPTKK